MAFLAIPKLGMRVLAEMPEPPVRDLAKMPKPRRPVKSDRLDWKGALHQKNILAVRPIPISNRAFCFSDDRRRDTAR